VDKYEREQLVRRVVADLLKQDPYWDRFHLARMVIEAIDRFVPLPEDRDPRTEAAL
jgi:hypothetical protein